ncbi:MAG: PEP-CTERM sorting domain-containing protein [Armatimonadetes bacterium]|nr:PEP-CTERM sorting domain-containing protein [Armatimonadota bacterium]
MRRILLVSVVAALATASQAFPLFPTIFGHDFNFGALNSQGPAEYATNGAAPDTLIYTPSSVDTEVTAYWPSWPLPPVFEVFNGAGVFGGDFLLQVQFDAQDAPYVGPGGVIDVSLTGTGMNGPGAADLVILGAIPGMGIPFTSLWEIDLRDVSLYGVSGHTSYVLEGAGTIVGGFIPLEVAPHLLGESGVMRGNLDFIDAPAGWMPSEYDPLDDVGSFGIETAYSGETGWGEPVPEPASMIALGLGVAALVARRRRKRAA